MLRSTDEATIKEKLETALDDLKNVKADDPNRINYLINRVDAAVQYGTQQTETRIAALEDSLAQVAADQQKILALLNRVLENANA